MTFRWPYALSHLYLGVVLDRPGDTIDPYDIGTYLLHQDYQVFCWLHGCSIRFLIPMKDHTGAYLIHWDCRIFYWLHGYSIHLLILMSYHLGRVAFLIEFIILIIPSFWVHFSCFGYKSYSFVLIFVSIVLGCKPYVSYAFSLLDYHFFPWASSGAYPHPWVISILLVSDLIFSLS